MFHVIYKFIRSESCLIQGCVKNGDKGKVYRNWDAHVIATSEIDTREAGCEDYRCGLSTASLHPPLHSAGLVSCAYTSCGAKSAIHNSLFYQLCNS